MKIQIISMVVAAALLGGCGAGSSSTSETEGSSSSSSQTVQESTTLSFDEYSAVYAPILDELTPVYTHFGTLRSDLFDRIEGHERLEGTLYFFAINTQMPFGYIERYSFDESTLVVTTFYTESDTQFSETYDVTANTDDSIHLSGLQYVPSDVRFSKPIDAVTLKAIYASENRAVDFKADAQAQFIVYGNGTSRVRLLLNQSAYETLMTYYNVQTGKEEPPVSGGTGENNAVVVILTNVAQSVCQSVDPQEQEYEGYGDYAEFLAAGGTVELDYFSDQTKSCSEYTEMAWCGEQDYADVGYGISGSGSCVQVVTFP